MVKGELKKGQEVYLRSFSPRHKEVVRAKVKSIGRRWLTVTVHAWQDERFEIAENYRHDTEKSAHHYELYDREQDIYDHWERERLRGEIEKMLRQRTNVNGDPLSLYHYRGIMEVLKV